MYKIYTLSKNQWVLDIVYSCLSDALKHLEYLEDNCIPYETEGF